MKWNFLNTTYFVISFFILINCKKGYNSLNPNNVAVVLKPTFYSYEQVSDSLNQTDTALSYNDIFFIPDIKYNYDSLIWIIDNGGLIKKGNRPIVKFLTPGTYKIKMITYGLKTQLTPANYLIDTCYKDIIIYDREGGASYIASFTGSVNSKLDSFTITIFRFGSNTGPYHPNTHVISNLPKGCTSSIPVLPQEGITTLHFGYKYFVSEPGRCFYNKPMFGEYKNGVITINYFIADTSKQWDPISGTYPILHEQFRGVKN